MTSLAAELATAPCIHGGRNMDRICNHLHGGQHFRHPECIASFLEALRRDKPTHLAWLMGMQRVGWGDWIFWNGQDAHQHTNRTDMAEHADCTPLYAFTPEESR